jgi:hypothetical protein
MLLEVLTSHISSSKNLSSLSNEINFNLSNLWLEKGGGLFTEGSGLQLAAQLIGLGVVLGWGLLWGVIAFFPLRLLRILRISESSERNVVLVNSPVHFFFNYSFFNSFVL